MAEGEGEASSAHQQESSKGSISRARHPRRQQPKEHKPKEPKEPIEAREPKEREPKESRDGSSVEGARRRRPDRHERQRRKQVAESSAPTAGGPSGVAQLNPSASEFVPRQQNGVVDTVISTQSGVHSAGRNNADSNTMRGDTQATSGNRGRPRGGRRGRNQQQRNGRENESVSTNETVSTVAVTAAGPSQPSRRPRNNGNARIQVQPKIIKESEDLMLRMTESLSKGEYDCSICTDAV